MARTRKTVQDAPPSEMVPVIPDRRTDSKEVIESYIFATSKRSFSIYSERLLMRIVEIAQQQLNGAVFRDGTSIGQVEIGPLGNASIEIPIKSLLSGSNNTNYTQAKNSLRELMLHPYEVERPKVTKNGEPELDENGNPQFVWIANQILTHCELNNKPGIAEIEVSRETWKAILDFGKGFRRYDLSIAMGLQKVSSLRLYHLMSNVTSPITYTIDSLREMWEMGDKYKSANDFIKRVIDPAKKDLDEHCPFSFEYRKNYNLRSDENIGRRGRKSITSLTFIPVRKTDPVTDARPASYSPDEKLGREFCTRLRDRFGFTNSGIKANMNVFEAAKGTQMDMMGFLDEIKEKAMKNGNPAGYVVGAFTRHLQEMYGIDVKKTGFIVKEESVDEPDDQTPAEEPKTAPASPEPMASRKSPVIATPSRKSPARTSVRKGRLEVNDTEAFRENTGLEEL